MTRAHQARPARLLGLVLLLASVCSACGSEAPSPSPSSAAAIAPSTAAPSASPTRPTGSAAASLSRSASPGPATAATGGGGPGGTSAASGAANGSAQPSGSPGVAEPDLTGTSYSFEPPGTRGGTLVVGLLAFPTAINPYQATSVADVETFRAAAFDGLVTITNDLRYLPDLATGLPLLSNGGVVVHGTAMDVTWELKPGMRWSDGQSITCADLEATWKWNVDPANAGPSGAPATATVAGGTDQAAGWRDVGSVEAFSDTTCVMHFTRVFEGYLGLVSTLLPKHYLDTVQSGGAATAAYPLTNPVAGVYSGPYVPIEVVPGTRLTFVPNPNWATIGGHPPFLDRLEFRLYPDPDALVAAYRSGEVQLAMDLGEGDLGRLGAVPLNEVRRTRAMTYAALDFNSSTLRSTLGDDWQTVVRAVRLAIDRAAIATGAMGGTVRPAQSFVSPMAWFAQPETAAAAPDPVAGRQLLDGAGWRTGTDGVRSRNGTRLALDLCTTQAPSDVATATAVAGQLGAIGIMTSVVSRPAWPDVYGGWDSVPDGTACNASRGTFEVLLGDHVSTVDPLAGYDAYVSGRSPDAPPHDGRNVSRASVPPIDAAYATVSNSVDLSAIRDAMGLVQQVFASDQNTFELPLYTRTAIWLARTSLHNFTPNPSPASGSWNIGDWWIGG